jgi:putative endopeptidase
MRLSVLLAVSAAALLAGCGDKPSGTAGPKPELGTFGIETVHIDEAVKPGDDFFKYVNGKWLATFQIPPDKARYGSFDLLRDRAEEDVHAIVTELAGANPEAGTTQQKVADLYASWMDEAALEARGVEPLQPYLDRINAVATRADLMNLLASRDFTSPFGVGIETDPNDPTRYTVWVGQGGLGMPNRDYYLNEGEKLEAYRTAYKAYVTKIFELIGDANPARSAEAVVGFEKLIATVHWTPEQQRVIQDIINPMDRAGLKKLAPAADWDILLAGVGLGEHQDFIVTETTAVRDGALFLDTIPLNIWKSYLTFHIVNDNTGSLPKAFDDASFEFYSKTLRGVEAQRERWKRGVGLLDGLIGEGVGEVYVSRHFPADNKAKMDALVVNLRASLESRLATLEWMDDATRAQALAKLATFEPRIGYPSKWRDYSAMTIEKGKLFENIKAANDFEWNRTLARLNQPVDRDEWGMNAQTVNASYNPLMNQITFPAAILQPPFFDANADPAVNYGAIGAVIGHEIGHGFDDQGREFDETGKVRNWWTEETNAEFTAATDALAAQYDAFCPLTDACVNGRLTMGENIGDLGGLQMAYTAYKLSLNGAEAPVIDGFTGDQRFFMAWAQVWRALYRDDAIRNQVLTDPHSPPMYRVNGVVRNLDAWYEAFGVTEGDALYLPPEQRVRIW